MVMSRPPQRLTIPLSSSFFVEKMEMLKVQANLEHDRGHSLCSGCSLINGTRGITITYPSCPHRCPKGHRTPAAVVAVGWEGSGQCFVQLLDYKKVGYTGRGRTQGLVVCWLEQWYSVWFMCVLFCGVCITARRVCLRVSVCD